MRRNTDDEGRFTAREAHRNAEHRSPIWTVGFALTLALTACSSDKKSDGTSKGNGESTTSEFDMCVASLQPLCKTHEQDTAEKLEQACKEIQFIEIPLTDGTHYGPMTIKEGPYGGKLDWNQGAGTEFVNPVNTDREKACLPAGIDTFMEPSATTDDLKNTRGLDYSLYTIFRPACMKEGEKYPVITWANGTCGLTHGYATLLSTVASHGFVIIASNSTWTATPPTDSVQVRAIDYAESVNEDEKSPLYHRLDLDKIGAMGHSQGAAATAKTGADPRVKSIILWNGGTSNDKPFLDVSGDRDIGMPTVQAITDAAGGATQPGAWTFYHQVLQTGGAATGHLVLMEQPDRVWEMAVAWWKWQLNGDEDAKKTFVGSDCGLCGRASEFEYGTNSHLE